MCVCEDEDTTTLPKKCARRSVDVVAGVRIRISVGVSIGRGICTGATRRGAPTLVLDAGGDLADRRQLLYHVPGVGLVLLLSSSICVQIG